MLSAYFWMGTGATLGVAAIMGLGLGSYVTSPQAPSRAAQAVIDTPIDDEDVSEPALAMQKGPGAIHCTGCGPTLAERQWQADMAAMNAVDNFDTGQGALPDDPPNMQLADGSPDMPSTVQPLRPQVARLVTGETAPPPVKVTRGGMDGSPPPVVMATAAEPVQP